MFDSIKEKLKGVWYLILESPLAELISSKYSELSEREKKILIFGSVFLGLFLVFYVLQGVYIDIDDKKNNLKDLKVISQDLDELAYISKLNNRGKRGEGFSSKFVSLVDLIEKQSSSALVKIESKESIKETPRVETKDRKFYESRATAKYNMVTIRQLKRLLMGIELNDFCSVTSLKIKRNTKDTRYIDVEFEVTSRTPKL
jgi:hypothetical protein